MANLGRTARTALAGAVVIGLAACAGGASPSPAAPGAEGTTVAVTLQEWAVVPDADSAPAGSITFNVTNDGPADVHEFVVMRTDLAPDALPVDETGKVDEAGEGIIEVIGEIEDIAVGDSQSLNVDLEAGSYVLLCNIYTEAENEAHYSMGMRIAFTVEG